MKIDKNKYLIIKAFEAIRDIPYYLGNSLNDASCSSKVKLLGEIFERYGLETRVLICTFDWRELSIPPRLIQLAFDTFGISKHYVLQIKYQKTNRWISIDPTWDSGLRDVLPISTWDGINDTTIAVPVIDQYVLKDSNETVTPNDLVFKDRISNSFADKFNNWLKKVRSKS